MGLYLNPGSRSFEMAVNSEIYVDKTELICYLNTLVNTSQRYLCVSRPRRFGKTMTADMLCAYYGRGERAYRLFESLDVCRSGAGEKDARLPDICRSG